MSGVLAGESSRPPHRPEALCAAARQGERPLQARAEMLRTEAVQKWPQVLQDDSF